MSDYLPIETIDSAYLKDNLLLSQVTSRGIDDNCILMSNSYGRSNRKKSSAIARFHESKIDLKHAHMSLTYADVLKKPEELEIARSFLHSVLKRYNGCLITDHGVEWRSFAKECLANGKKVYMASSGFPGVVYHVRPLK